MTLLVAVCEQTIGALERVEPRRSDTLAQVTSIRDHVTTVLRRDFAKPAR